MDGADDRQEVERAVRGERRAVETLYARYRRPLLGFLRRQCGDAATADDVFQEVWLKVWTRLDRYRPEQGEFRAWLYRVAANAAHDRRRRDRVRAADSLDHGRDPDAEAPIARLAEPGADPGRAGDARLDWSRVRRTMEALPEARRTAILLRHHQGFSYAEIGTILDVPEGTAKTLVHRGLKDLRRRLGTEATA